MANTFNVHANYLTIVSEKLVPGVTLVSIHVCLLSVVSLPDID